MYIGNLNTDQVRYFNGPNYGYSAESYQQAAVSCSSTGPWFGRVKLFHLKSKLFFHLYKSKDKSRWEFRKKLEAK